MCHCSFHLPSFLFSCVCLLTGNSAHLGIYVSVPCYLCRLKHMPGGDIRTLQVVRCLFKMDINTLVTFPWA